VCAFKNLSTQWNRENVLLHVSLEFRMCYRHLATRLIKQNLMTLRDRFHDF